MCCKVYNNKHRCVGSMQCRTALYCTVLYSPTILAQHPTHILPYHGLSGRNLSVCLSQAWLPAACPGDRCCWSSPTGHPATCGSTPLEAPLSSCRVESGRNLFIIYAFICVCEQIDSFCYGVSWTHWFWFEYVAIVIHSLGLTHITSFAVFFPRRFSVCPVCLSVCVCLRDVITDITEDSTCHYYVKVSVATVLLFMAIVGLGQLGWLWYYSHIVFISFISIL